MKFFKLTFKRWMVIGTLALVSTLAIYYNAKPVLLTGYVFSLALIFLLGISSNKVIGGIIGFLSSAIGLALRTLYPVPVTLKGKALEKFMTELTAYQKIISDYFYLMILGAIAIGVLGGVIGEILSRDKTKKLTTNRITTMAVFIALSVVFNTLRVGSVSFGGFPIIYSGFALGPIGGFIVGALADLIGFLMRPAGTAFHPIFTLTSALTGLIPVIVVNLMGERYPKYHFIKILAGIFVGQMITSVLMVPYFQAMLYAKNTFSFYALKALVQQAISIPLYAFLIDSLNAVLFKVIIFNKEPENI